MFNQAEQVLKNWKLIKSVVSIYIYNLSGFNCAIAAQKITWFINHFIRKTCLYNKSDFSGPLYMLNIQHSEIVLRTNGLYMVHKKRWIKFIDKSE